MPQTATPGSVDEVAAVLQDAAGAGLAVQARGGGTKPHWGALPRACDLVVELAGLDRIVDHTAGDMVVQVEAGVSLRALAAVVARAGQQLALDVPRYDDGTVLDAGTVGGALAVGLTGPRQLRYGAARDLVLGVTMVRADGQVASSGGRVVKNVAGYDLGKLLSGSYGTLGLIVAATLRLHPLPAAVRYLTARLPDPAAACACAEALLTSQLAPSAVEIDRPGAGEPVTVAALFEGTGEGVAGRAAAAAALVGGTAGANGEVAVTDQPPDWFGRWPGHAAGTLVEVSTPPAALAEVLAAVDAPVRGSAGAGVLQVAVPAGADPTRFLAGLRSALADLAALPERAAVPPHPGSAVVRHAPTEVRAAVDVWGPVDPGALALMRRVKDQFDPDLRLAPGRFVGGI